MIIISSFVLILTTTTPTVSGWQRECELSFGGGGDFIAATILHNNVIDAIEPEWNRGE